MGKLFRILLMETMIKANGKRESYLGTTFVISRMEVVKSFSMWLMVRRLEKIGSIVRLGH